MARNRDKKALYEVMGKTLKPRSDKALEEKLYTESQDEDKQKNVQKSTKLSVQKLTRWPNKPKIAQFNFGRIEVSVSYPLAIALILGLILVVLIAFRLGQISGSQTTNSAATGLQKNMQRATLEVGPQQTAPIDMSRSASKAAPVKSKGDNRIVIQAYQIRTDLQPVKQYFAGFGIETEIIKIGDWYYLVTVDKYENPEKPGTDGYAAKQKIIELGAGYKAPLGYETFGSKPFRDAYGKKFNE